VRYLDYFLLFGGVVSMIYLYGSSWIQRNRLKKRFLNPENKEAILKESFYDESVKQSNLQDIRTVESRLYKEIKERHIQGIGDFSSDIEEQLKYIRELRFEIDVDAYTHQLAAIPVEERSLDNWDSF